MAETKPMTTASLSMNPETKPDDANKTKAAETTAAALPVSKKQTADKARQPVEDVAKIGDDPAPSTDQPYPTQADLDAMREGKFDPARKREAKPEGEGKAEYKTR